MEHKKLNELNDEALDAVAGGVKVVYNEGTRQYEVYGGKNEEKKLGAFASEKEAQKVAMIVSTTEKQGAEYQYHNFF